MSWKWSADRQLRHCPRCVRWLAPSAFGPSAVMADGLNSWCRECCAARNRQWRAENPGYVAAANAARRVGPVALVCSECGGGFEGRPNQVVCGRRCRDARYRRRHPEAYRAKERRKQARRRAREAGGS